jgi:hypothetical protein
MCRIAASSGNPFGTTRTSYRLIERRVERKACCNCNGGTETVTFSD